MLTHKVVGPLAQANKLWLLILLTYNVTVTVVVYHWCWGMKSNVSDCSTVFLFTKIFSLPTHDFSTVDLYPPSTKKIHHCCLLLFTAGLLQYTSNSLSIHILLQLHRLCYRCNWICYCFFPSHILDAALPMLMTMMMMMMILSMLLVYLCICYCSCLVFASALYCMCTRYVFYYCTSYACAAVLLPRLLLWLYLLLV